MGGGDGLLARFAIGMWLRAWRAPSLSLARAPFMIDPALSLPPPPARPLRTPRANWPFDSYSFCQRASTFLFSPSQLLAPFHKDGHELNYFRTVQFRSVRKIGILQDSCWHGKLAAQGQKNSLSDQECQATSYYPPLGSVLPDGQYSPNGQ